MRSYNMQFHALQQPCALAHTAAPRQDTLMADASDRVSQGGPIQHDMLDTSTASYNGLYIPTWSAAAGQPKTQTANYWICCNHGCRW
jgi:hypothetical protein